MRADDICIDDAGIDVRRIASRGVRVEVLYLGVIRLRRERRRGRRRNADCQRQGGDAREPSNETICFYPPLRFLPVISTIVFLLNFQFVICEQLCQLRFVNNPPRHHAPPQQRILYQKPPPPTRGSAADSRKYAAYFGEDFRCRADRELLADGKHVLVRYPGEFPIYGKRMLVLPSVVPASRAPRILQSLLPNDNREAGASADVSVLVLSGAGAIELNAPERRLVERVGHV